MSTDKKQEYQNLLDCYRSGQISEKQWQEHLKDEGFAEWVKRNQSIKRCANCAFSILNNDADGESWVYHCGNPEGWYFDKTEPVFCPPVTDCPTYSESQS